MEPSIAISADIPTNEGIRMAHSSVERKLRIAGKSFLGLPICRILCDDILDSPMT